MLATANNCASASREGCTVGIQTISRLEEDSCCPCQFSVPSVNPDTSSLLAADGAILEHQM